MKLYSVELTKEILVVANSATEAEIIARQNESEVEPMVFISKHLTSQMHIPKEWRGCLPYGAKDQKKVEEYL